jgi:hypothetical protein
MATIPGSQFIASAPGMPVNVQETTTGTGLPTPTAGDFNLEVYVGSLANVPALAPGYQGLAVLTSGGLELDLISGAYAVTDNGTGLDSISAYGDNQTVSGGAANVTLNVYGYGDVATGGGQDTIGAFGDFETVTGGGNDLITDNGNFDQINDGGGADTITVTGSFDAINLSGTDTVGFLGGSYDTVTAGAQPGTNADLINLSAGTNNFTFADGSNIYADTVVGFDQATGDRIHLTTDTVSDALANSTQVNSGQDTLITLSDHSTILLKGVTHVDSSFFK